MSLQLLNLVLAVFRLGLIVTILIVGEVVNLLEQVEEGLLLNLLCLLATLLALLLHDLHSDVLSLLPVDLITIRLLDLSLINIKMLSHLSIRKPLILREVEVD